MSTVLVTGASGGIGRELAIVFARNGWDVALAARSADKLSELAGTLERDYKVSAHTFPIDLTDPASPQKLLRETAVRSLAIDALVNNAGIGTFGFFSDIDIQEDENLLELNIAALTKLTKLFMRPMLVRRKGYILNVASTAAFQPGPLMAVYYASKAYVLYFSEALANELEGSGVSVTALCPGAVKTGFQEAARMTGSKLFKNVSLEAVRVAEDGYEGMMKGRAVVVPGLRHRVLSNASRFFPRSFVTRVIRRIQETDRSH